MTKKKAQELNMNQIEMPGGSSMVDFENTQSGSFENSVIVDTDLIESIEKQIQDKKEEIKSKVYAVTCSEFY